MKSKLPITYNVDLSRRRTMICLSLFTAGVISIPLSYAADAPREKVITPITFQQFVVLSQFLLNKEVVNEQVAKRLFQALPDIDDQFISNATNLLNAIKQNKTLDVESLKEQDFYRNQQHLRDVAITIISGWYLGYVGSPENMKAHDNSQFISFREALMYVPTKETLVIPSYAKWNTNYWKNPPVLPIKRAM